MRKNAAHPAKFTPEILAIMAQWLEKCERVLDPFAGTGLIHALPNFTVGVELEPEWASIRSGTIVGNALELPFPNGAFDGVATSPTYGNRMADHHNAKDASQRNTYRHTLGRPLHTLNSGQLQWGKGYQIFHMAAWHEVYRVLRPGGLFVLNVSDHIRKGEVQYVCFWHEQACVQIGFEMVKVMDIETPRNRFGANGHLRVPYEKCYLFRKSADGPTPE